MTWNARWLVCGAALAGACYGEIDDSHGSLPTIALEVSEFEDHGVDLQFHAQGQGCKESSVHGLGGHCSVWDSLRIGGQERVTVTIGTRGEESLSGHGCSGGRAFDDEEDTESAHVWKFAATRLPSASPKEYRFDVAWEHIVNWPESAVQRTEARRILALREDQHYVLDFLSAPPDASGCVESAVLEVVADPTEPAEFRDRALRYDVWYVRGLPDGTESHAHTETIALHGEETHVRMPVVRLGPDRVPLRRAGLELVLRAGGSIRGRLRTDGAIDLMVGVGVQHAVVEPTAVMSNPIFSYGQRAFRVEPGQALRIESSRKNDWRIVRRGEVVLTGDDVRDHTDAFIVTVEAD